jgi:hypothetical protein
LEADSTDEEIIANHPRIQFDALEGPRLVLVPKFSPQACVFAHAKELREGKRARLTLTSHSCGIVKRHVEPKGKSWLVIELGGGLETDAISVQLLDNFLVDDQDRVFDVDAGIFGNQRLMWLLRGGDPEHDTFMTVPGR